nr:formamidopyrimidine-DNA glycosylase [Candidatus Cloacimonadota bacterium]
MPELPEVQTVLNGVCQVLNGRQVLSIVSYYPGTVIWDEALDSHPFPADFISGMRRGKYMILHFSKDVSLIVHLRMTGKLVFETALIDIHRHERARIELDDGSALRFIDPRTFGKITVINTENLEKFLPQLGPEPLGKDFTPQYLYQKTRLRSAPIKNLLLDQSIVAGLGNIYTCELLYRAGVRPQRISKSITHKEANLIIRHSKEILMEAIAVGGTSISDYRQVDDKRGEFQNFLKIYQKKLCPLGHDVENIRLAGRSSFFCPKCQK